MTARDPTARHTPPGRNRSGAAGAVPPTPVHVLTGFLGAGKTTLLNRLLRTPELADAAVVVNEFGDVGIDHLLVERSDDLLVELPGGCLCCVVRGDLATTLEMLLARRDQGACRPFRTIVIETSGLAEPNPILNLLVTDPLLADRTMRGAVVAVVDAINGPATLAGHSEAVAQVALADRIVVTKGDLADPARAAQAVRYLNPDVPVEVLAPDALPDAAALFREPESGPGQRDSTHPEAGDARAARSDSGALHAHADAHAPAHGHEHGHHDGHLADIHRFTIERQEPLPAAALSLLVETLAQQLGANLLRVKGLVYIAEAGAMPAVLHGAQHVFHPLAVLPAWPVGSAPATRLVFITRGDWREFVVRVLDAIVAEVMALTAGGASSQASGGQVPSGPAPVVGQGE